MKTFNGKAIYNPSGKAGEYSYWACNFYVGCSNGCEYCYCKKGVLGSTMGGLVPTLKKCFKSTANAIDIFEKELLLNLNDLQQHGLFFSFTTDPMLFSNFGLTIQAIHICLDNHVPVKTLSKYTKLWVDHVCHGSYSFITQNQNLIAFGFTLTGHDELEPNASTNAELIEAMRKLHDSGYKTFASIEPVINFADSLKMIEQANPYCDLFKIGLLAGDKNSFSSVREFMLKALCITNKPVYFKDSLLHQAKMERTKLPKNCVTRDFKLHKTQ
jgi:DNA repair photolyase